MTIQEILSAEENGTFERKSIHIEPKALAIPLVAFANADGGIIAIGISDRHRKIEGTDQEIQRLNELLRVPFDFCEPSVRVEIEKVSCVDMDGMENHIILMHIEPSEFVHANQADEVFLRVGDKSKKLTFDERMQLVYDKGEQKYENRPMHGATLNDIDMHLVEAYVERIGYRKAPITYLKENKGFVKIENGKEIISVAAILLFGKNPQLFLPRARVRFIRFDGVEEKVGAEMNVIKDVIFEGNILKVTQDAISYLDTQIKEKTYLGKDGLFVTEEEYPKFVRQEIVVNAIAHRAYSISGTDIQIKMFDDRIEVESPGKLPGLVRTNNIRHMHFSRNPIIAEFLKAYEYVKEYGEGVDRMCRELEEVGLPDVTYQVDGFMVRAVVRNANAGEVAIGNGNPGIGKIKSSDSNRNPAIEGRKSGDSGGKVAIGDEKSSDSLKKVAIRHRMETFSYNKPTKENILLVCEEIEPNQVFGTKEISEIVGCSVQNARKIMTKLREIDIVIPVRGKGKGKYILNTNITEDDNVVDTPQ